jgi:hypothetical protein
MDERQVSVFGACVVTPIVDGNVIRVIAQAPGDADQKGAQSERSDDDRDGEQKNESKCMHAHYLLCSGVQGKSVMEKMGHLPPDHILASLCYRVVTEAGGKYACRRGNERWR